MGENQNQLHEDSEVVEQHEDDVVVVDQEAYQEEEDMEKQRRNIIMMMDHHHHHAAPAGHSSTQSSHRLLAYSDALISIIATVMILPVAHTKIADNEELRESIQLMLSTKIAVYLMTFMIVTMAWAAHVRLFQVIERIDDSLALLNLACMMLITFLPYTVSISGLGVLLTGIVIMLGSCGSVKGFSLMATFPNNILGILLFCACVMVIGLIQAVIVVYAFSRPFLLNEQIQISENQTFYKHHILKVIMRVPFMCFFASIFAFIFFQVAYVLLAIVIFVPYITQSLKWCRSKAIGQREETPESMQMFLYHPNEPLSKERVEAFSDGVYAIVATLLILDICEDNIPDADTVQKQYGGSLVAALQAYGPEFLAYFGSFATVGLLWFVHHSLFLHVTRATRFMGLLNTFSLAFVGGLPLAYQLTHEFPRNSRNELEAIQISCVIIFFAGIFQLAIWIVALFDERNTLHPKVRYGGSEHAFMLAKLALYPSIAFGTFFLTCILSRFSTSIFHLMEITVPFAFLVLRLLVRVALALLRLMFCPDRPDVQSVLEEEEEEEEDPRLPFNALVT